MLAFVVEGSAGLVKRVPIPAPKAGEALVRVFRAGVCNTDLEIMHGYMGFKGTLGHEFVGVVEPSTTLTEVDAAKFVGKRCARPEPPMVISPSTCVS